ncbi:penicillin-binding protein 1A [Catenovulum agarivorans DS-2]|uniref:Penicillin-binding protein 1A n=1 Tax=Catenovulum agarivorans DS-2 TaxID=1328313 RepID=W7QJU7_9ALTE|nr:penicillin-binding protein 1A [Catenovulum agarivorans]EWH09247.1 penicillin-binding protein 1A [Catenovulum agarivorans DS-2]
MKKFLIYFTLFSIFCVILGVTSIYAVYLHFKDELPPVNTLKQVEFQTPMKVYTADGKLISQFGEKRRIPLQFEQIPQPLIDTLLATEDVRFYSHKGVDFIGIFRAALAVITSGNKTQGASTLTMQVARGFFLTRDKTYIRKIKEIFIALHIEQELTKEEILTLYINKVELGYRAFGFGAAAQVYYGKDLSELNIAQFAMLTGLLKAPTAYNPLRNPKRAKFRRDTVLWRLKQTGHLTEPQYQAAIAQPLTAKYHGAQIELDAPYIAEMVRQQMVDQFGEEVAYTKGYQVYTTITEEAQNAAQLALRENLHNYDERHGYRGAFSQLWQDPETPWQEQQILEHLNRQSEFGLLKVAVVTAIDDEQKRFQYLDKSGEYAWVNWDGMSWARPFIDDDHQGEAPQLPSEIVKVGEQIYLRQQSATQWQLSQFPDASSALVALNPTNGAIIALSGGYDFYQSEFNRVTQAKRQVGSNIKPFIYSAALEHGFTLASIINDAPINQWDRQQGTVWRPRNSPPVYDGPTRMRTALAKSKNVISVRLLRSVGLDNLIDHLAQFGFSPHDLPRNESLALGSASFTPMELASAYTAFANGGFIVEPFLIDRVVTPEGEMIFAANPKIACDPCAQATSDELYPQEQQPQAKRAISAQNAFLIAEAMQSTIWGGGNWNKGTGWNGTGWRAQTLKRTDIGGKTGTTNEAKDTWFSGYGPNIVVTSWVGFDDHSRALGSTRPNPNLGKDQVFGKEFGAQTALPAWIEFLRVALADVPQQASAIPDNIVSVRIDNETGKLTTQADHTSLFEYFIKGTEPSSYVERDPLPDILNAEAAGEVTEKAVEGIF